METKNTTAREVYGGLLRLKFRSDAASKLRLYLSEVNTELEGQLPSFEFIRHMEALLVFLCKLTALKSKVNFISVREVEKAITFFEYYTLNLKWKELYDGKNEKIFPMHPSPLLDILIRSFQVQFSPNGFVTFREVSQKMTAPIRQILRSEGYFVDDASLNKFSKLIEYSLLVLSRILTVSLNRDSITSESANEAYRLVKFLLFKLEPYDVDFAYNVTRFLRKELFLRLLEYYRLIDSSPQHKEGISSVLNHVLEDVERRDDNIIVSELKSALTALLTIFRFASQDSGGSTRRFDEYVQSVFEEAYGEKPSLIRDVVNSAFKVEVDVRMRILISDFNCIVANFQNEVSLDSEEEYLLPDLSHKIGSLILVLSRVIAVREGTYSVNSSIMKKAINTISSLVFTRK